MRIGDSFRGGIIIHICTEADICGVPEMEEPPTPHVPRCPNSSLECEHGCMDDCFLTGLSDVEAASEIATLERTP